LAAWLVAGLLPPPLDLGLMVTAAIPCTLASAAVWTRRAGGNDAVALIVTMVTNLGCFLVTPLLLWLMAGANVRGSMSASELVWRLFLVAVLPMLAGQLLRLIRPAARFATRLKAVFSTLCQLGILTMVLIGAVQSGLKLGVPTTTAAMTSASWVMMLVAVAVVHLTALYVGFGLGRTIGLDRADWIAVGFAGSQKTLMIGLDLALALDLGIGMLPMIAYHAVQLIFDTLVADRLAAEQEFSRRPRVGGAS
jgi:sodium/bile acid cotransporter 7